MSLPLKAEYRAFLLKITRGPPGPTQDFRLVKSNLDPFQYPTYYPVKSDEQITYVDTWMCRGRTGNMQPICPSPHEATTEPATPASAPVDDTATPAVAVPNQNP